MPEPIEGAKEGVGHAGDVLTRKIGPLPLWAWAAGLGIGLLLVRLMRGGRGTPTIAGVAGRFPDSGVSAMPSVQPSAQPAVTPTALTPSTATGGQSFAPPPLLGPPPPSNMPPPQPTNIAPPPPPAMVPPVIPAPPPSAQQVPPPAAAVPPPAGQAPAGYVGPVVTRAGETIFQGVGQTVNPNYQTQPTNYAGLTPQQIALVAPPPVLTPSSGVGAAPAAAVASPPPAVAPSGPAFIQGRGLLPAGTYSTDFIGIGNFGWPAGATEQVQSPGPTPGTTTVSYKYG